MIDRTAPDPPGRARRRPAGFLCPDAVARHGRDPELTGALRFPVSDHQNLKEKLREGEKLTATSLGPFAWAER